LFDRENFVLGNPPVTDWGASCLIPRVSHSEPV
jgi:hypothetical protein